MPPIFRPVQMTLVADRVTDFNELISALRHADNVSSLPIKTKWKVGIIHALFFSSFFFFENI